MTVAYADFTMAFPEFSDGSVFPQGRVNFWIQSAYLQLNAKRFENLLDLGVMLFVAHNLVLSARDEAATKAGGLPGQASGPQSSKSVDKVSVSYDTGATIIKDGGAWNATSYGQRLYTMIKGLNAGPVFIAGRNSAGLGRRGWT